MIKDFVVVLLNVVMLIVMVEVVKFIVVAYSDCMSVKILEKVDCEKLGMGFFLGVFEVLDELLKFIYFMYKGVGSDLKKVVVVGKGLTFDFGGYNLKAGAGSMIEMMKFDMGGFGVMFGVVKIIV